MSQDPQPLNAPEPVHHYTNEQLESDPVYALLQTYVLPGNKIVKAEIIERKVCLPKQPRKLIYMTVEKKINGKVHSKSYEYNYNKLLREIKKNARR